MIQAIVFDFDGVLADSEPLHLRAYQDVLAPLGIVLTRDDYYSTYLGYNDAGVFARLGSAHGVEMGEGRIAALIEEKSAVFDALLASTDVLYPGAAALVDRLGAAFPLGIASGALKHEIRTILRGAGLEDRFRFIVASGDTPRSKPSPDPYLRAAELHGLPAGQCLAIEDSHWGIESARAAGLRCIAVPHTYPATELGAADAVVPNLEAITPALIASRLQT
jgi:beta-phosphoglucomutase